MKISPRRRDVTPTQRKITRKIPKSGMAVIIKKIMKGTNSGLINEPTTKMAVQKNVHLRTERVALSSNSSTEVLEVLLEVPFDSLLLVIIVVGILVCVDKYSFSFIF